MQSLHTPNRRVSELAEAECRVPEINSLIDHQREFIEELERKGVDLVSAKIVLDSLLVSLSLSVSERHRLRSILGAQRAEAA
jgi:hypothetical protein